MGLHNSRLLLSALTLLVVPATLLGQNPQIRKGFWIGFGAGYGSAGLSCNGCGNTTREGSVTGFLKLGGTLSQSVLLGVESNGWFKDESGDQLTMGNLSAVAYFYPMARGGFFLKAGPGLAYQRLEDSNGNSADGLGFGFVAGAGYDIRVGKNISITPEASFNWGHPGDLSSGTASTSGLGLSQNVIAFGVGVTFH